jgi:hypothetical protein
MYMYHHVGIYIYTYIYIHIYYIYIYIIYNVYIYIYTKSRRNMFECLGKRSKPFFFAFFFAFFELQNSFPIEKVERTKSQILRHAAS